MANTVVEFDTYGQTGLTLTADVHAPLSDTLLASGKTCTEQTNRKGVYRFTMSENVTGLNLVRVKNGSTTIGVVPIDPTLADDTNTYEASDRFADVKEWLGTKVATPTVAGVPEVDLVLVQGDAQHASDFHDFLENGYDAATNKVNGVKLVDTTTTNTDMVAEAPAASAVAAAVEAAILDEGDATALLAAISAKVEEFLINDGDATATLAAIATAIRTELATELAHIDADISSRAAPGDTMVAGTVSDKTGYALTSAYDPAKTAATQTSVDALPTDSSIAAAVWGAICDGTVTFKNAIRRILAGVAGTSSGNEGVNPIYKSPAGTKNRLQATVDSDGNRDSMTYDDSDE